MTSKLADVIGEQAAGSLTTMMVVVGEGAPIVTVTAVGTTEKEIEVDVITTEETAAGEETEAVVEAGIIQGTEVAVGAGSEKEEFDD